MVACHFYLQWSSHLYFVLYLSGFYREALNRKNEQKQELFAIEGDSIKSIQELMAWISAAWVLAWFLVRQKIRFRRQEVFILRPTATNYWR